MCSSAPVLRFLLTYSLNQDESPVFVRKSMTLETASCGSGETRIHGTTQVLHVRKVF